MLDALRKARFPNWTVPLALLATCLLGFGLLIPWLGFYWDDWPAIWFLHFFGPSSFTQVFSVDRPLLSWLFLITTRLVGESMVGWQIFGVLTHWLCCLALWWTLWSLWPRRLQQATWVAFVFAVYPGFKQQTIAVTYSHDWIVLALFFVSLAAMIWAVRKPYWFWPLIIASWLLSAYVMFADEYYFGLELLRPVILWMVLSETITNIRRRTGRALLLWLPYLLIMILFLVWRLVIHVSPRGDVQFLDRLRSGPAAAILNMGRTIITDAFRSSVAAWGQVFNFPQHLSLGSSPSILYIIITLIGIGLVFWYLLRLKFPAEGLQTRTAQKQWAGQALLLGGIALLVGGIPFWMTDLPIGLSFPWDRFNLAMALGASLALVGLITLVIKSHLFKVLILAILVGLGIGLHLQNATLYRREWAAQKAFFWQLAWRAPGLQPGTVVMSAEMPFVYFSDNSLTAPLNWIYAPQGVTNEIPYIFYNIESRQDKQLTNFNLGQPIEIPYRIASFNGSTSQALAIYYSPPGCVKVVNPETDAALPQKPRYFSEVLPLSKPDLVIPDPASPALPPEQIFGPQPEPDWCYYFEKADLAYQSEDWQKVVELGEQAFGLNQQLYEVNAPELVPFIEGYAHLNQWDKAVDTTLRAYRLTNRMQRMLCATWLRIEQETQASSEKEAALDQIHEQLNCQTP
jgi:hypothetical protein